MHGRLPRLRAALCVLVIIAFSRASWGQSAAYQLNIHSLPLDQALQEFASQSGVQIVFFSQIAEGVRAPELTGRFALRDAMERLLATSDLSFRVVNAQTIEVLQAPRKPQKARARKPPPASASNEEMAEVLVQGTAEQLVATRVPTPLQDIPQSISIVSREQIRQQNDVDLADALRHTPGITSRRSTSLDEDFYSRAFKITSFHVDGGAALYPRVTNTLLVSGTPDLSEFDHVEVLRGSDALFSGNGNPGGTVSLVRKRPPSSYAFDGTVTRGSWDNRRVELDLGGPLTEDGALRGRADTVYAKGDYFFHTANHERESVFGVLEYDLEPDSTITVGGSYQWEYAVPVITGLPPYADGTDPHLSRDTALTFDWAFQRTRRRETYVQYRKKISDDWNFRLNAAAWRQKLEFNYGSFDADIDPETQAGQGRPSGVFTGRPNVHTQNTVDLTLTGTLHWLGMREELAVGVDYTRFKAYLDSFYNFDFGPQIADVRNFDPRDYPDPRNTSAPLLEVGGTSRLRQYGGFASMRVYFNDAWSLAGGLRLAGDSLTNDLQAELGPQQGAQVVHFGSSHVVTPYGALMYRINDHYSWYTSYADIYSSVPIRMRADGGRVGPAHGVSMETGIKGAWRDGALNGSLALYHVEQRDLPVYDASLPVTVSCCFVNGTARSRGVDLALSGEPKSGWLLGTGYTYNSNRNAIGGETNRTLISPLHLLKVWTSVNLRGPLQRWTIGGTLQGQSKSTFGGSVYCLPGPELCPRVRQKAYAVLDLRAAFNLDRNWEVALSANNALDKVYYEALDEIYLRTWYGEPRNFTLRIDRRF